MWPDILYLLAICEYVEHLPTRNFLSEIHNTMHIHEPTYIKYVVEIG